mgnify:CR=1 FL=1
MNALESLGKELEQEAAKTRKFLERLPESRLDWRPHPKSETLGGLAAHLVQCIAWTESIFAGPELDFDPVTAKRAPNDSVPGRRREELTPVAAARCQRSAGVPA